MLFATLEPKLILVDTGAGELLGPKLDKLPDSLRAAGVQPEQITDILLTHIHPDHSGGLTVGGRRVFPNATVHVNKLELDYWTNKSLGEKAPEPTKTFFQQAGQTRVSACGACTVHVAEVATRSCVVPVSLIGDRPIVTIEGISTDPVGRTVQEAWVEKDVVQCGYCQSGQIMSAVALLKATPKPIARVFAPSSRYC
jgi:hypothetical protein